MQLTFEHEQYICDGHNPIAFHYATNYMRVGGVDGTGAMFSVKADTPLGDFDTLSFGLPEAGVHAPGENPTPALLRAYSYSGLEHWIVWRINPHRIAKYKYYIVSLTDYLGITETISRLFYLCPDITTSVIGISETVGKFITITMPEIIVGIYTRCYRARFVVFDELIGILVSYCTLARRAGRNMKCRHEVVTKSKTVMTKRFRNQC